MENLVVEAKKGNKEAYSELFGSVYNDLYKIAMSKVHNDADAKDAIQNAFFTAFKNINNLHHNKNFKAWISRILRNKCYALLRKRKETTTSLEDYPSPDFNTDNIDDIVDFRNMLERLNKVEKEVIKLKYEDGLSIKEISSLLNINENTVKTHLSRGKQKLSRSIKPVTIMIILCAFLVTSVIAACIISYVKELFDINSAGRHNEGVLEAIEHLEWFQDVDMDYIDLG
ncbi:MAG: RNA polymerase sigma factor, partial [Clostridia bacterium]|nr:RNA polymerase sigma factor [Clostridia bacterium]